MPRTLTIRQGYYYAATPEAVWSALTEPKQLAKWFLLRAKITLKAGGDFKFAWHGGYKLSGKVKKIVPGKLLTLTWPNELKGGGFAKAEVTFKVSAKGKGTMLRLVHKGYTLDAEGIELYGGTQSGWAYFLTNLKSVLEHGFDLRSELDQ